jgi:EAL domain-containing protein (putative c-di-GMP-specific phosphodiesterase class I)
MMEYSRLDIALLAAEAVSSDLATTASEAGPPLDIPRILNSGPIQIAFQPIVHLNSLETIGYEALARFPAEEIVSPKAWFDAAEAQGLTHDLEILAVASALAQLDRLPEGVFVSLNVSPTTAASEEMRKLLEGVDAERIILEVKENATMDDYQRFVGAIDKLRSTGVRVAVDDAGAGDVSVRQMLDVRPDIIKIDVDVTRGIEHDPVKQAIANAFRSLAAGSGAMSLAEGIETDDELEMLKSLNIGAGQGYLLGRPEYLEA